MAEQPPALDGATKAALQQLADIVAPPRVPFVPQTWGWAALLAVALLLAAIAIWTWRLRRRANRYRREALAELDRLEAAIGDDARRNEAVLALPPLVKRVALAAWPRRTVAPLSGDEWVAFLRQHAGGGPFPDMAAQLFKDGEYQAGAGSPVNRADAQSITDAARQWIEDHRVSA
jgi:hypothetical protein